ncbi:DUF401 family protein [Candidatus Bipolaricaulota bacterium]|nr:DUF401 family protein [Candidatus Bipolaricaulota bacterium]
MGAWIGFGLSLLVLFSLSRWELGAALIAAAGVLGFLSLPPAGLLKAAAETVSSPGMWLLTAVVMVIPAVGALLARTGRMGRIIANLPLDRRWFYGVVPAIFGLLPMPGGALLSAPLLEEAGGAPPALRAAVNVWFRHILLLVYPLSSALIVGTKLAGFDVWQVIPYQLPWVTVSIALGYLLLLRRVSPRAPAPGAVPKAVLGPLATILVAPFIDLLLKYTLHPHPPEIATLCGVGISLALAGRGLGIREWFSTAIGSKPWRYGAIVVGMFLYLGIFQATPLPGLIGSLPLSPLAFTAGAGFALGFATGRVQMPLSIMIPVYLAKYGGFNPWSFSLAFFSVYLGYLISPIHPCLSVSIAYAKTSFGATIRELAAPAIISLGLVVLAGALTL